MIPEHSPNVIGQIWEKVKDLNFWGPDPLGCIWMLYVCSGDMVCALETWYVLYGRAICPLGIDYAVWTCYMSSGDGICCVDMVYVFWRWNMLYGHGICFLVMEYIVLIWNKFSWSHVKWYDMIYDDMIWYYMMLFKTFEACVRLAAGAFFLEKTHILKKWYFLFLRKTIFAFFVSKTQLLSS